MKKTFIIICMLAMHFMANSQSNSDTIKIKEELMMRDVPFAIINGNYEERLRKAIVGIEYFVMPKKEI